MNHDSENFEQLRRLLSLKRHEQPPPGYFNNFSRQVCARIKAGERADSSFLARLFPNASWIQQFWSSLETQPILAGAVGLAACAFLLGGVVYSTEKADLDPSLYLSSPAIEASVGLPSQPRGSVFEPPTLAGFQLNNDFANSGSQNFLFPVQPVSFTTGGN
jgi:hypothetical protein